MKKKWSKYNKNIGRLREYMKVLRDFLSKSNENKNKKTKTTEKKKKLKMNKRERTIEEKKRRQ